MPASIWNAFGIRVGPFFQEALDLFDQSLRPIELFVGREEETEAVLNRILGSDSSRLVIAGLPGVGKTTFIQHLKRRLLTEHGFAAASEHLRVSHSLSATQLGVELVRAVLRSYRTTLPEKTLEGLDGFEDAQILVERTVAHGWQASASVLGIGGGAGHDKQVEAPAFGPEQFHEVLARLVADAMHQGLQGTIVHLNNLENLERDPAEAALLFRDARDYFLVPGLHVILGATPEFHGSVLATFAQVRSVFSSPIRIEPLALETVEVLLQARYEHLRIAPEMEVVPPVTWEVVQLLHELFWGDLRGMLSALDEACYHCLGALRAEPLRPEQVLPVLAPIYREHLTENLGAAELAHLRTLAELGGGPFRQAEACAALGLSQGRVSKLFASLERASAIVCVRVEGRTKFYSLAGRARVALA